jgi:hypothetical protein
MAKHQITLDDPASRIRELQSTLAANSQQDQALLQEQLALESIGVHAEATPPPEAAVAAAAQRFLNGHAERSVDLPGPRLYDIKINRAGLRLAAEELDRRLFAAIADNYRDWTITNMPRWREITRHRAEALLALRAANQEAAAFRAEAAAVAPGVVSLPDDRVGGIFSADPAGDAVQGFLENAARSGIIHEKAIKR